MLKHSASRSQLVLRYLLQVQTADVLKIFVIKDFWHKDLVEAVKQTERDLGATNLTKPGRAALVQLKADQIRAIREHPDCEPYLQRHAQEQGRHAYKALRPLITDANAASALLDFKDLWYEAHLLAVDMYCHPHMYRFDFVKAGHSAFFNVDTMICVDPRYPDPAEIKRHDMKVKMCITPVVTETKLNAARVVPKTGTFSEVLVCQ